MVNSMSSMGNSAPYQYGPMGVGPSGDNVFNKFHAKYGCGYEDFAAKPYERAYSMSYVAREPHKIDNGFLSKLLRAMYL